MKHPTSITTGDPRNWQNVSASTRRKNPHLFAEGAVGNPVLETAVGLTKPTKPAKRIRQSSQKLTKLEQEYLSMMIANHGSDSVYSQSITLRICNGLRYTPDAVVLCKGKDVQAYEVKGKHAWDDAIAKLKMAAHEYPAIRFVLVWKDNGRWQEQVVMP